MDQEIKDEELIRRTLAGEVHQFSLLVNRYQKVVYNLVFRMVGNRSDADDLAQETFIRAYLARKRFDLTKPFKPWILKIASNLTINRLKEVRNLSLDELAAKGGGYDVPNQKLSPETLSETEQLQRRLQAEILRLPVKYRVTFTLRYLEGHSIEDISRLLEIPINTVKIHLFRAREFLKKRLKDLHKKPET